MKRPGLFAFLFLTLVLAACEGTKEPELPLLLAAADESAVHFYLANALREGSEEAVGTWAVPGALDLAARDDGLWLLTEGELRRYAIEGFSETAVPTEESALAGRWALPEACPEGRLHPGGEDVLVVCAADAVYRWHADTLEAVDTAPFAAFAPAAYALVPDPDAAGDLFAVAYARAEGWHFALYAFTEDGTLEASPRYSQDLTTPTAPTGFDLVLDPTTPALHVLAAADPETPALFVFMNTLKKLSSPENVRLVAHVTANQGAAVAYGEGFFALVEGTLYERATYVNYQAGWVSPDLYLYLASEDRLAIWDVAGPPELLGTRAIPDLRALTGFPLR